MRIMSRYMDFIVYFPVFGDMYASDPAGFCQLKNGVPRIDTRKTAQPKDPLKGTDKKFVHNMSER